MEVAIRILYKSLDDAAAMQRSDSATSYCESLRLAIQVLEDYNKVMREEIRKRLKPPTV